MKYVINLTNSKQKELSIHFGFVQINSDSLVQYDISSLTPRLYNELEKVSANFLKPYIKSFVASKQSVVMSLANYFLKLY